MSLRTVLGVYCLVSCLVQSNGNLNNDAQSIETFSDLAVDDSRACDASSQPLIISGRSIGTIESPGFNGYSFNPRDKNCSWTIVAPEGHRIWIEFVTLRLDKACEGALYFYDGPSADNGSMLIDRFCGWDRRRNFNSPRNVLHIRFDGVVDSSNIAPSFSFWFMFVRPPQSCDKAAGERHCKHNVHMWHMVNLPNKCYKPEHMCDGNDHCGDGTDEEGCSVARETCDLANEGFLGGCGTPVVKPIMSNVRYRIKGGRKANPGSWPWQVSIRFTQYEPEGHACGGVLLGTSWLLTAAHCFSQMPEHGNPSLWTVHLGRYNKIIRNSKIEVVRYIESIHYHPNWSVSSDIVDERLRYDIALVKLNAPAPVDNDHIRPACLPPPELRLEDGSVAFVSGWGEVHGTGFDLVLKQAAVPVISRLKCQEWYPTEVIDESLICAGYAEGSHDSCQGDSGGPLVVKNKDEVWELAGIVANGGLICGTRNKPGIYTRVAHFVDWIRRTAGC